MSFTPVVPLNQNDLSAINRLVSEAFGYLHPHHYFEDFPIWSIDTKANDVLRLGIFSEENGIRTLISHAGIHFAEMQTSQGAVKVALIGAVATDAKYRGQGISTTILHETIARTEKTGAQWIFLWGSEHHFYKKFGFELMGNQGRVSLLETRFTSGTPSSEIKIKTGLTDEIFKFLVQQKSGIRLGEKDRTWFFKHQNVKWFYVEQPFAFVGFERGMDLEHLIHEWGGDENSLRTIFAHVLQNDSLAGILGKTEDLLRLGFDRAAIVEEYLCLARATPSPNGNPTWNSEFWISGLSAC